jgi:hypothetical protein
MNIEDRTQETEYRMEKEETRKPFDLRFTIVDL